jgi:hypothetical protein
LTSGGGRGVAGAFFGFGRPALGKRRILFRDGHMVGEFATPLSQLVGAVSGLFGSSYVVAHHVSIGQIPTTKTRQPICGA